MLPWPASDPHTSRRCLFSIFGHPPLQYESCPTCFRRRFSETKGILLLSHLIRSKGPFNLFRRGRAIVRRVGFTTGAMGRALRGFARMAERYAARVTLPVPAVVLARHAGVVVGRWQTDHARAGICGAWRPAHRSQPGSPRPVGRGNPARNRDFSALGPLLWAFARHICAGAPALLQTLAAARFAYDSSQCVIWPVMRCRR